MAIKTLKARVESFKNTTLFHVIKYITHDCDIEALESLKEMANAQIETLKMLERNSNGKRN